MLLSASGRIGAVLAFLVLASCHTGYTGIVRLRPGEEVGAGLLTQAEVQRAVDLFQEFAGQRGYDVQEGGPLASPGAAERRRERGLPQVTRWMSARGQGPSMDLLVTEADVSICLFLYTFSGGRPESFEELGQELRSAFAAGFGEQRVTLRWQAWCDW